MPNARSRLGLFVLLWLVFRISPVAFAQTPAEILEQAGTLENAAKRRDVVAQLRAIELDRRQKAEQVATARRWPKRTVLRDGSVRELVDVSANGPVYFTTHNTNAAISTGTNLLQAAPFNLTGAGIRIGVWDAGTPRATHDELNGRVTLREAAGENGHSTHVAGTLAASGVQLSARGMAPAALIESWDFNADKSEMTSAGAAYPGEPGKVYLSNHSYGFISGWNLSGSGVVTWDWWGTGTTAAGVEDDFGKYQTYPRDTDAIAVSLPYYLIFRSAGNDRSDNPTPGTLVALTANGTTPVAYDPALHPGGDGTYKGGGYDTIGFDAVAKNVITVGSVGDAVSNGERSIANAYMSGYSAWGPTDDGRIKPDIVANGESLYSSYSGSDSSYTFLSGTSMSTPNATGSAAVLISYFDQLFPGHAMRASTLKALIIHTADDLGTPGPDYQYGWGLMNAKAAADLVQSYRANPGTQRIIEDRVSTTRTLVSHPFTWDGVSPIRATLCWTDPAGTSTTTSDSRTARLVNNLNLELVGPNGATFLPYVMPYVGDWTVGMLGAAAVTGVNNTDNVEQVFLAAPSGAGQCQARVSFSGSLTNGSQQYSLIITGGASTGTAPAPGLSSVSPATSTGGAMTLTVTGTNILLGATVKLTRAGAADVVASGIEVFGNGLRARIDSTGMAGGLWDLKLLNPDGQSVTLPNAFSVPAVGRTEALETGIFGWSHTAPIGTDAWALATNDSHSPSHSFFAPGPATRSEQHLISPAFEVPATGPGLQISFWHKFTFQSGGSDGGVMELSVDGGAYFGINDAGSGVTFGSGGYTGTISSSGSASTRNPLAGLSGWIGTSDWEQTTINVTDTAKFAGKILRARWRLGTNNSTASAGWHIDDLTITGANLGNLSPWITTAAAAAPSLVTGTNTQLTAMAGDDAGESGLIYTWSVNDEVGAPITISPNGTNAAKTSTATFSKAGNFTFTLTVTDGGGKTVTNTANVQVNQTLTTLTLSPKSAAVRVTKTQTFTAVGTDQFNRLMTNAPAVTWSTTGGGTINASGLFTAGLVPGGPHTVTAASGAVSRDATVTILPNSVPVVANDGFSGNEDLAINGNVLSNDSDPEGDPMSAILVTNAAHGSVSLNANGSFTYAPVPNYFGPDGFNYKVNDGIGDSASAVVSITVNPVNDAPVAVNDTANGNEDSQLAGNVLANDTDIEGNALTAELIANVAHGVLVLNANGSFTYTPAQNYSGADSFIYRANDGTANSNTATVTITVAAVNDPPVAVNDVFVGNEDVVFNGNVIANDSDVEGSSLTAALVANVSHGTVTLNPNGTFSYTPAANYAGADSFTYRVNDGNADSNVATVTFDVQPVNDAPFAVNDSVNLVEDTSFSGNVLANDTDVEGNSLNAALVTDVAHGVLILNANGTFTYTPAQNYAGLDSFSYRANDGALNSNVATVAITVSATNDAPVAVNDAFSGNEDFPINGNVIANDTDVEGSTLTATLLSDVVNGTLTLNANGTFTYTPGPNYAGSDSFLYRANDGTADSNVALVTITVNPVNDGPVAVNDTASGNEDAIINGNVLGNDSDAEGTTLAASLVTGTAHGALTLNSNGSFTYTPAQNYFGPDSFSYQASDGLAESNVATVTITVSAINDAPVAVNDAFSGNEDTAVVGGVLGNDTDVENASLTANLVSQPSHGTVVLNANGTFNYTPAHDYAGSDSFTYKASDGESESAAAAVTITLNPINDPPIAAADTFAGNEDTVIQGNVAANDSDVDGPAMAASVIAEPVHGALSLNADGSFTYTPAANFNGPDSFTYKMSDGTSESAPAAVSLVVNAVNDAPVAVADALAGTQGLALTGAVLGNDSDVDGDSLTAVLVAGPLNGSLTLNANGGVNYVANSGFTGSDSFTYKVSDGVSDSNVVTVTLTVGGVLFSTWTSQNFTNQEIQAGLAADLIDFDRDGLVNLIEYAIGSNPRVPNAGPVPQILSDTMGDRRLTFVYSRPSGLSGIVYGVEVSADMVKWDPLPVSEVASNSGQETVVVRDSVVSLQETRRFMRLQVQRTGN